MRARFFPKLVLTLAVYQGEASIEPTNNGAMIVVDSFPELIGRHCQILFVANKRPERFVIAEDTVVVWIAVFRHLCRPIDVLDFGHWGFPF
jgi:hypothetical protein